MRIGKTKLIAVGAATAAATLAIGGYAYFTSSGSGTGTATVGSTAAVALHGTTAGSLYPGTSSTVSFTLDNPSTGHQFLNTIHLAGVTADVGHASCDVTDFTMPNVTANQDFPAGNGQTVNATGTLSMANTAVNQDACQGATLTLNLTSN